jgi:hypothetical protein
LVHSCNRILFTDKKLKAKKKRKEAPYSDSYFLYWYGLIILILLFKFIGLEQLSKYMADVQTRFLTIGWGRGGLQITKRRKLE